MVQEVRVIITSPTRHRDAVCHILAVRCEHPDLSSKPGVLSARPCSFEPSSPPSCARQRPDITNPFLFKGKSIYGAGGKGDLVDENFELTHTGAGILSMANSGPV